MFRLRILFFVFLGLLFLRTGVVEAQPIINRVVPSPTYFDLALARFNNGELDKALADFNGELRRAVKFPDANGQIFLWLDSMVYWTMCGECHYQMGRYDDAMMAFNNAVQIYLYQPNWLSSLTFAGMPTAMPRQPFPWGVSERKGSVGSFDRCGFQMLQENINIIPLGNKGVALAQQQSLTTIRADEIISRMALMIRRRAEILGPLSKYDPQTKELAEVLGGRPCPPNHFSGVWVDVLYGLALSAMGDDAAAATQLEKGLLMQGLFDHQLTPVALNELGNIALRAGKYDQAVKLYHESSFSAYLARDTALLGETFRNMADAQKLVDKSKPFPPVAAALKFFETQKNVSPLVFVPLCHETAEDALTLGNLKLATDLTAQGGLAMKNRKIVDSVHGARNHYLSAVISYMVSYENYASGKPLSLQAGDAHLSTALGFMRNASLWLYHLRVLENLFQRGEITTRGPVTVRIADELYALLLRDPTAVDWALQPMDSLTLMTFAPPTAYQRWFFVALQRGDREKAFEISELARRAKFYSSFPLGPRLFSLRLLFEGDNAEITQEMLLERQTLSLDFTRFGELSSKVREIKQQLLMIPIVPRDPAQTERQKKLFADLETLSMAQEAMLRPIALTRTKAPNAFPPVLKLDQIRGALPEKTAMLVYFESLGNLYGFLIDKRNIEMWPVLQEPRAPSLQKLIVDFLEGMGNRDMNRSVTVKDLADPNAKWKKAGYELLSRLLGDRRQANFTELVVVPTGPLWYVPFEAMTVKAGDDYRPLIAAADSPITIRYAPMASLGLPRRNAKGGSRSMTAETLIVYGKFVSKAPENVGLDAIDRYAKMGVKKIVPMPAGSNDPFPASASAFVTQVKHLVVLDDIPTPRSGQPLDWSPFNADRNKLKNTVASWLVLPWGGPQLIVLPGFHTPAENSLKTGPASKILPNGDDLFLSAMAMEACGARTILISRWRTGGRASYDLVGEFLKNYETRPAAEAWRQAIIDIGVDPLNLAEEPRVRAATGEEAPIANHPFFWGAFMLIDQGEEPETAEAAPDEEGNKLDRE